MRVEMSSTAFMLEIVPTFAAVVNNSNDHVLPQGAERGVEGPRAGSLSNAGLGLNAEHLGNYKIVAGN